MIDDVVRLTYRAHLSIPTSACQAAILHKCWPYPHTIEEGIELADQQAGLRGTLAARPAAHEHHLVVEACHVRSPDYQQGKFGRSDGLVVILNIKWRVVFERMRRSPRRFCRHDVLIRFPVRQSFLSA